MIDQQKTEPKLLIVYASRFGSTQGVAETIGDIFRSNGRVVDIRSVEDVTNLEAYDAAVIGSAIQYDTWLPEATAFIEQHKSALSNMPVAYFFTCLTLSKRDKAREKKAEQYAQKLIELAPSITPLTVGRFAGALDYKRFSSVQKLLARIMFMFFGVAEGDYREWDLIRAWATDIDGRLTHNQATKPIFTLAE